ncbi:MAG: hypothetical protein HFH41_12225 [Lachnospiraceae bacterium]|nr:hypothetical protein [Lachnospiraceae bacterium]
MKNKKKNWVLGIQWMFGLLLVGMLLYFVLGEFFLPRENEINLGGHQVFEAEWNQKMSDGTSVPVKIPGVCATDQSMSVRIETQLPKNLEEKTWMCFHSSRQDMKIYIEGKLRLEYTTEHTRMFGKNSASAYIFLELQQEDAGKMIQLETISDSVYSGRIDTIYIGERMGILLQLLRIHGGELLFALLVGILGIITVLLGIALHYYYHKMARLEYLGWGMFLNSVCLVMASRLRQFLFPNISVASGMAFFAVMLMPLPFLIYLNSIQRHRYQKCYLLTGILVVINLAACTTLQVLNLQDFSETSVYSMGVIIFSILISWFTICVDIRKRLVGTYHLSAIGFAGASLAGILEMVFAYQQTYTWNGTILCGGMLFFLALAIVETGQYIFQMEREKQQDIFANKFKGRFLVNMSQEMKISIDKVIQMNEKILQKEQEEDTREYAKKVQRAGNTLLDLVTDMIDFSSMDAGNLELDLKEYSLASLVEEVHYVLKRKAREKQLQIRINVDEDLPSVLKGDGVRIRKILTSLFANSVKYTQEGSITFSVQGIRTDRGEFYLSLSVADTGIGIEKEYLEDIFDMIPEKTEEKEFVVRRTGLDLHMIRQLTEQMEGKIKVWSVYGRGSLFTIEIPQEVVCGDSIREQREGEKSEEDAKLTLEKFEGNIESALEEFKGNPEPALEENPELRSEENWIEKRIGLSYCGEDEEMYQEVLQAYYQQGQNYCQEIPKLLEEKNWKDYGTIAHAVKSTSMTIGAPVLSEQAKQQELAAKEGREADLLQEAETFFQNYQRVLREAQSFLDHWGNRENTALSSQEEQQERKEEKMSQEEYLQGCRILLEHIRGYEMREALEQIEVLAAARHQEILEKIRQAVDDFAYDTAEDDLLKWIEEQESEDKG